MVVDNDGQQIPDADLPRLWDPFYRVDKARNRSDGGTGLGLTIVRAAVLAHGGTCEVENRSGGVRFRVSLHAGNKEINHNYYAETTLWLRPWISRALALTAERV